MVRPREAVLAEGVAVMAAAYDAASSGVEGV